jgi:hypothetical protein
MSKTLPHMVPFLTTKPQGSNPTKQHLDPCQHGHGFPHNAMGKHKVSPEVGREFKPFGALEVELEVDP